MWRVSLFLTPPPTPCHVIILPFHTPPPSLPRRRHRPIAAHQQNSNLGHSLLSATAPIPKKQQEQGEEAPSHDQKKKKISGSDVLIALERANSLKKKKKKEENMKKKRVLASVVNPTVEQKDYNNVNVAPLCINTQWGAKLDDLEKRLSDLSSHVTTSSTI